MDQMENSSVSVVEFDLKGLTKAAKSALRRYAGLSRKGAMALHEAGRSLSAIKDHKPGRWSRWVRDEGIALTTADQAVALYRHDPSGEKFKGMGITEAKVEAGIIKPKNVVVGPHVRTEPTPTTARSTSTVEEPPTHESESTLRMLVKINHALAEVAKLDIPTEDREQVDAEVSKAIDVLKGLRTQAQFKVVA